MCEATSRSLVDYIRCCVLTGNGAVLWTQKLVALHLDRVQRCANEHVRLKRALNEIWPAQSEVPWARRTLEVLGADGQGADLCGLIEVAERNCAALPLSACSGQREHPMQR